MTTILYYRKNIVNKGQIGRLFFWSFYKSNFSGLILYMSYDQKHSYEIHIVSYNKTKLVNIPEAFERLVITDSQVCLNEVTSFHDLKTRADAVAMFNSTVKWFEQTNPSGEIHIKLEYFMDLVTIDNLKFISGIPYPTLPKSLSYDENYFIGGLGWDVHIDGTFDPKLKKLLIDKGWVYLNYLSHDGKKEYVTLTQHFLCEEKCSQAYNAILGYLKKSCGFAGDVYWEDPVRYLISTK